MRRLLIATSIFMLGCFGPTPAELEKEEFFKPENLNKHKVEICKLAKAGYLKRQAMYGHPVDPAAKCEFDYNEYSISLKPNRYMLASKWVSYGTDRNLYDYRDGKWSY